MVRLFFQPKLPTSVVVGGLWPFADKSGFRLVFKSKTKLKGQEVQLSGKLLEVWPGDVLFIRPNFFKSLNNPKAPEYLVYASIEGGAIA